MKSKRSIFILFVLYSFVSFSTAIQEKLSIFRAAKDFNHQFGIRHWTIHFDNQTSSGPLHKFLKESNQSHTIAFNDVSSKTNISWSRQRTMHLYISNNFVPLKKLLIQYSERAKFNYLNVTDRVGTNVWIIQVNSPKNRKQLLKVLKASPLRFDSEVYQFHEQTRDNARDVIKISDIYKLDEKMKETMKVEYGHWNSSIGLITYEPNIWKRRSNMHGYKFRVESSKWEVKTSFVEDGCNSSTCFRGWGADIFHLMQKELNFTYTIVSQNDAVGRKRRNGSYSGIIGMILNKNVDFAISTFSLRESRMKVVDFMVVQSATTRGYIYVKNPKETFDWEVYSQPFWKETWIFVILFSLVIPILTMIILARQTGSEEQRWYIGHCYELMFTSLLMLGSSLAVNTMGKRVVFFTVCVTGMFLFLAWDAMLISYFTLPTKLFPFNNWEEFLTETDNKLIVRKGTIQEQFFRDNSDPIKRKIYIERILPHINGTMYKRAMCDVMEEIANESNNAYFKISSKPLTSCRRVFDCSVVIAPFTTGALGTGTGWMFLKRSPFLPIFNYYYNMMKESGSIERLRRRRNRPEFDSNYYKPKATCQNHEEKAIAIYKSASLFIILMIGVGVGFLIFTLEMLLPSQWFTRSFITIFTHSPSTTQPRDHIDRSSEHGHEKTNNSIKFLRTRKIVS